MGFLSSYSNGSLAVRQLYRLGSFIDVHTFENKTGEFLESTKVEKIVIKLPTTLLTDINECAPNNITGSNKMATRSACHHICTNVEGSFLCSCRNGYTLMYNKKQCKGESNCISNVCFPKVIKT